MAQTFAEALMGAEADALCGAPYCQPSEDRVNYRNGYRDRRWDTRAGAIELAIPRWSSRHSGRWVRHLHLAVATWQKSVRMHPLIRWRCCSRRSTGWPRFRKPFVRRRSAAR